MNTPLNSIEFNALKARAMAESAERESITGSRFRRVEAQVDSCHTSIQQLAKAIQHLAKAFELQEERQRNNEQQP